MDHHFVALVEVEGAVWELDGRRKSGAKLVGNFCFGFSSYSTEEHKQGDVAILI